MSESENVRRLRDLVETFNSGDFDAVMEFVHPDVELKLVEGSITGESLRGAEAVRRWLEPDAFESIQLQIEAVHEHGDRLLVDTIAHSRAAGSGIELDQRVYQVVTMREGRASLVEHWLDRERALESAGLTAS
jgi:ketosteroid isomerase-like protein